jgi:hypothetical protein
MRRLLTVLTALSALTAQSPSRPSEGGKAVAGEEITCDLAEGQKFHNKGGTDGAGLCVFASITWAARYQNELRLCDLFNHMLKERGGGYPQKVDAMIQKYGKGTPYLQYEGGDPAILKAALASGRMPCVTYNGNDCHYRSSIAHMVCLVHLSDKAAVISDNNFPGDNQFVWMSPEEFLKRWRGGAGGGWAVVLLSPPPPPVPTN